MLTLYGIKNCDTVKKARRWLDQQGLDYQFHDFKKDGLDTALLSEWEQASGWESLINRRGTTWRKLPETVRDTMTARTAREVMLENPSIIKRPVVNHNGQISVGFDADDWAARLKTP